MSLIQILMFLKLNDKGLKIVSQMVPNDEAVNFMSLLINNKGDESWISYGGK